MTDRFDMLRALRGGYTETAGEGSCPTHGSYPIRIFHDGDRQVGAFPTGCMACSQLAREEKDRRERKEAILARIVAAGVPPRFLESSFLSYEAAGPRAANHGDLKVFARAVANGDGAVGGRILLGTPGTGKTHLAIAVLRAVIVAGHSGRYSTVGDMVRHIRSTWSRSSGESEADVIRLYAECRLLVLDEVGVSQTASDNEVGLISDVIDQRYRARRPTVLAANLTVPELARCVGDRVLDRLMDNGGRVLLFDWSSYRKERAA